MYSIITILVLVFIAYKISKLVSLYDAQTQKPADAKEVKKQQHSSTLNPLFSEEEIAHKKETSHEWQKYVERYFNELFKQEKEEVEAHQKSGKDKSTFKPSEKLLDIILKKSMALLGRNSAMKDYQKMIESNISILNGEAIEKVKKAYWNQVCTIPYDSFDVIHHPDIYLYDKDMKEMHDSNLKHREEFWRNSWDYILKKDYVQKEKENKL